MNIFVAKSGLSLTIEICSFTVLFAKLGCAVAMKYAGVLQWAVFRGIPSKDNCEFLPCKESLLFPLFNLALL